MYDSNMKYRWDNQNVIDFAREEEREEGREEASTKRPWILPVN